MAKEEAYYKYSSHLQEASLSNSNNFDKSILSLSSGALVLSLAFIRDIVSISKACSVELLWSSWILFTSAIISTLISFWTSQSAITKQLAYAAKYYLEDKEEFLKKNNCFSVATKVLNYISGGLFITAVILTVVFVFLNLTQEVSAMSEEKSDKVRVHGGYAPLAMQGPFNSDDDDRRGYVPSPPPPTPTPSSPDSPSPPPSPDSPPPPPSPNSPPPSTP